MSRSLWKPAEKYKIVVGPRIEDVTGYTYNGLGLRMHMRGSPKGRRPPMWNLTHLNSGHKIVSLHLHDTLAFKVATQIANLGDWSFNTLGGWRNRDPELRNKVAALLATYGQVQLGGPEHDEAAARKIALERA